MAQNSPLPFCPQMLYDGENHRKWEVTGMRRLAAVLMLVCLLCACEASAPSYTLDTLPAYDGQSSVLLDENQPDFPSEDKNAAPFCRFSPLDLLGRCGTAYACVGPETMPSEERGGIGMIKPAGWHTVRYDFIDGKYLYNRCHLIGYQLCGENANECNLITGTRYLNIEGMLPYENQVADYIRRSGNHVLYRATPIYDGLSLVCSGVEMEGWSVEDEGAGVCFHIYAYNVQPGVQIDYLTGLSWDADAAVTPTPDPTATPQPTPAPTPGPTADGNECTGYILNTSSKRFHLPTCPGVATMSEKNRRETTDTRDALLAQGYVPCGTCKP